MGVADSDFSGRRDIIMVEISFDPTKREKTFVERGLDFAEAAEVFAGPVLEAPDARKDYGELRVITIGLLRGRMVVIGWTLRGDARHVFTMRKANARERKQYGKRLEES